MSKTPGDAGYQFIVLGLPRATPGTSLLRGNYLTQFEHGNCRAGRAAAATGAELPRTPGDAGYQFTALQLRYSV